MQHRPVFPAAFLSSLCPAAMALWLAACGAPPPEGPAPQTAAADTLLLNGRIVTVDGRDSIAEALAIKDGKIAAVGPADEIRKLAGQGTQVIDLHGLTATPGLIDAHCHLAQGGIARLYSLDLSYPAVRSVTDIVKKVAAGVEGAVPGSWIQGEGWDEGKLAELRHLHAADLDRVSPENPVWLVHTMGHYGTANNRALKLAGITRDTTDPPGGTIDRHPDGTPTGVLKESAMDLVRDLIPAITAEQIRLAIASMSDELSKEGMTAVKDPGIDREVWEAYQRVHADGNLGVRVFALWSVGKTVEDARRLIEEIAPFTRPGDASGDDRLISGGIKIYMDGSGGARTAWLHQEWNKNSTEIDAGNYGYPALDPEVYRRQVALFHDSGLHVGTHAIGDRAIDWVVDTYASVLQQKPTPGLRHSIIHANVPTEHALKTLAGLQRQYDAGYPEPSPGFMWWIGDTYAGNWGPERSRRLNPFKSYAERGIRWAAGSDYNVTPFPARYGIWASAARRTLLGVYGENPYGTEESVDVRTALRSYTIWGAHQIFLDRHIGSLEPGKQADIAVWDKDLTTIPAEEIKELKCLMTLLGGKITHLDSGAPIRMVPAS